VDPRVKPEDDKEEREKIVKRLSYFSLL